MNPSYDGGAPPYPGQPAPNMPPQYGNMPPQYGNPQPNMTPQYGNAQPNMQPQYGNMQPNMTPQYGNTQPNMTPQYGNMQHNMTPQNGNMQPGPNVESNFAQSKLDEVNACDLPPTSENDPSAPMPDDLPSYSDYVGMHSDANVPTAPPPPPDYDVAQNDASEWTNSGMISEEDALSALREHCKKLCCWGEGPIDKMKIKTLEPSTAYKYKINTWTENRETSWKHEPYHGGPVDGEFNGPPPSPWSIPVQMPAPFTEQVFHIRVPHTENVRMCQHCHGRGRNRCWSCHGRGHKDCGFCSGGTRSNGERCTSCNGNGRKRCITCHGNGWVRCRVCQGAGQLKHFIQLEVKFHTHDDDYVYETTDLPDKLILKADGTNMFNETADRIGPILNYYVNDININSASLVQKHATKWPMERIWKQSHKLDSVPVFEMRYDIKGEEDGRFWVYGDNQLVYSEDYPAQCCCCCNVPGLCNNCSCCNSCTIL